MFLFPPQDFYSINKAKNYYFHFVKSQYMSSTVDLNFSNFFAIEVHEKVSFALLLYYNLSHDVLFKSSKRPQGERSHMGHQIEMKK